MSYGEVDGSSPCIPEEARCCRSAHPSGPHQSPGNQAYDTKVLVHKIACGKMIVDKPTLSKHPHNRYSLTDTVDIDLSFYMGFRHNASTPNPNLEGTGGHYTVLQGFEGNVGKSPRKSQVHPVNVVHVGGI